MYTGCVRCVYNTLYSLCLLPLSIYECYSLTHTHVYIYGISTLLQANLCKSALLELVYQSVACSGG